MKTSARKTSRKYGPGAEKKIHRVMEEWKDGELRSGRSGAPVSSRKQAVAIALSEARRSGKKVPARKRATGKPARRKAPRAAARRSRTKSSR